MSRFFFFSTGHADGNASLYAELGVKGAHLAEMARLGINIPPGVTIPTSYCKDFYSNGESISAEFCEMVLDAISKIEQVALKTFAKGSYPLLLSIRSGASISMPGMLDTVLNLGMHDALAAEMIAHGNDALFVYDTYRRLLEMYLQSVCAVSSRHIDEILFSVTNKKIDDTTFAVEELQHVIVKLKALHREKTGVDFPQDPYTQLWNTIVAVFKSWNTNRARKYRAIHSISDNLGTAVNICAMVFGNKNHKSASGVCFTRDPLSGEKKLFGEYLLCSQGEDVVAGIRTPNQLHLMKTELPEAYNSLENIAQKLESYFKDVQDLEFTVEDGQLWLLQARRGKRTSKASFKIALDMVHENILTRKEAVNSIEISDFEKLLLPGLDPRAHKQIIGKGLATSPGAASGRLVFFAADAERAAIKGEDVILVRDDTSPDDIGGIHAARGLLTTRGGMTSHAAIVARQMGKCCVAGCGNIQVFPDKKMLRAMGMELGENDFITIDGSTGEVLLGKVATRESSISPEVSTFLEWATSCGSIPIYANADTVQEASYARQMGAVGIGLCRTERVFFERETLPFLWRALLANTPQERREGFAELEKLEMRAIAEILEVMQGCSVAIRLFDHPLIEFLPQHDADLRLAEDSLDISKDELSLRLHGLVQSNPALGHRGCRLGIAYPEIYEMQIKAVLAATKHLVAQGKDVRPQIMLPFVCTEGEIKWALSRFGNLLSYTHENKEYKIPLGVMIETPRSALIADKLAQYSDFLCIGANDLTQLTFGMSRDDATPFLRIYKQEEILTSDPLSQLDLDGVGYLIKRACELAHKVKPSISIGLCSENQFDVANHLYDNSLGIDFLSCPSFRVPVAILQSTRVI